MEDGRPTRELPWTRGCFVCGAGNPHGLQRRSRLEGDRVVLEHTTRSEDQGWEGIVHGGVTVALLDEVMTWAAILEIRRAVVAAELTTRLRLPIGVGVPLRVEGEVAPGSKPRLVRATAQILDPQGQVLASASGKYMPGGALDLDAGFVDGPAFSWLREHLGR
jgi:acyl-coenzyme A thioesterase PaaI-like protein